LHSFAIDPPQTSIIGPSDHECWPSPSRLSLLPSSCLDERHLSGACVAVRLGRHTHRYATLHRYPRSSPAASICTSILARIVTLAGGQCISIPANLWKCVRRSFDDSEEAAAAHIALLEVVAVDSQGGAKVGI